MSTDTPPETSAAAVERWAGEFDTLCDDQARMHWCHYHDVAALLRALSSQLEEARRDAERLRKLATTDATLWIHDGGIVWTTRHGLESLRAAIDAAMAASAGEGSHG